MALLEQSQQSGLFAPHGAYEVEFEVAVVLGRRVGVVGVYEVAAIAVHAEEVVFEVLALFGLVFAV